jgi:membrane protein YdbS with pleckstrin-like domain
MTTDDPRRGGSADDDDRGPRRPGNPDRDIDGDATLGADDTDTGRGPGGARRRGADPGGDRDTESIPLYRVGRSTYDDGDGYTDGTYTTYEDVIEFDDVEIAGLDTPARTTMHYDAPPFDQGGFIAVKPPSDLVRRYLYPTEKFRGEWRRHWIHLVRRMTIGILATFVLGYLAGLFAKWNLPEALTVLVIVWVIVISWVLWDVVEWYFDRFILTNKRIMLIEGIISRRVAMMPLARVTDMKYTQSPMGRVLNYGTFEIESAGQDQALRNVENLPNPTNLYLEVVEEMYEPEASEAKRQHAKTDDGM